MSSHIAVPMRRNGKPQSCEPCRKSKVRCDHKTPVCARCVARGVGRNCIYHPAPLTKCRSNPASVSVQTPRGSVISPLSPVSSQNNPGQRPGSTAWSRSAGRATPATDEEFLGSTSFSAVIDDDRDVFDRHANVFLDQEVAQGADTIHSQITEERIVAGMAVLKLLMEVPNMGDIIHKYHDISYTYMVPAPFTEACVASIQEVFHSPGGRPKTKRLRKHVLDIFENTCKPLKQFPSTRAKDYHTVFTGPNLRWEIIGFVLAMLGLALKYGVNTENEAHSGGFLAQGLKLTTHRILEAVEYCTTVCRDCNSVNHQALWLLYGDACLKSHVFDDMSYQVWRCLGDLSSMYYALGLHHDHIKSKNCMPYYQYELRGKYASQIFSMDKTLSTLLGRPPRISGRYCCNIMAADVDDSVLFLENDELEKAMRSLDENGWNTDGNFRRSTWRRVKLIVSQFREEVLEVCLGTPQDDIKSQIQDILVKHEMIWNQIPSHLKYDEITGSEHVPPLQRYAMMTAYMDQNYNRFLLHRKLVKATQCSRKSLYEISRSLLATVLQVIALSDQTSDMHRDISWFILYYGLPGASILAVDLLKQSTQSHNSSNSQRDIVPRSEVIQNLSVLISNLKRAFHYGEVNQNSCKWAHRVLSCIMDEILDPKPHSTVREEAQEPMIVNRTSLSMSTEINGDPPNIDDFLSWVEEADWNYDSSAFMI